MYLYFIICILYLCISLIKWYLKLYVFKVMYVCFLYVNMSLISLIKFIVVYE